MTVVAGEDKLQSACPISLILKCRPRGVPDVVGVEPDPCAGLCATDSRTIQQSIPRLGLLEGSTNQNLVGVSFAVNDAKPLDKRVKFWEVLMVIGCGTVCEFLRT